MENNVDTRMMTNEPWKGYSLDELRYRIAVSTTRKEIEIERIKSGFRMMTQENSVSGVGFDILKRMVGALNILDYAVIAFKLGLKLRRIYRKLKN